VGDCLVGDDCDRKGTGDVMATTTLAAVLLGAEETVELPASPAVFALSALAIFALLLGITWAFRNWASKH
jgi:hypothetical protein